MSTLRTRVFALAGPLLIFAIGFGFGALGLAAAVTWPTT